MSNKKKNKGVKPKGAPPKQYAKAQTGGPTEIGAATVKTATPQAVAHAESVPASVAREISHRAPAHPPVVHDEAEPLLGEGIDIATVNDKISTIVLSNEPKRGWWIGFLISLSLLSLLGISLFKLLYSGIGIWGINQPVGWGFAILNFVWWVGIGHAGTLISAILLLFKQEWRTSINRFAEAMTIFAVCCAGVFPLIHVGRVWLAFWLTPYPNTMGLWPQFRSPLAWDVFAVSTYASVGVMFWYVGLIPDLATLRDRATNRLAQIVYGVFALGWRGSAKHWERYETAYLLLAGLATPLVLSVHTVIGFDFAVGQLPGWHNTLFPPYFVAGAVFSGFAMVLTLAIPLRKVYGLEGFITIHHLSNIAKVLLTTGMMVAYGYIMEVFIAWYSGSIYEWYLVKNRAVGAYAPAFWALWFCNILVPQVLWSKKVRENVLLLWIVSIIVNIGMWLERFVIIVTSLHRDFLPSSWGMYKPTIWDISTYLGTFGLFFTLFFLFIRFLPMISIFEMRHMVNEEEHKGHGEHGKDHA